MTTTSGINEERPELGLYNFVYCIFLKQRYVTFIGKLCCSSTFFLFYAWKQLNKQTNKELIVDFRSKIAKHQRVSSPKTQLVSDFICHLTIQTCGTSG